MLDFTQLPPFIVAVLGIAAIVVLAWALMKTKGMEGANESAASWKSVAEAMRADKDREKDINEVLRKELDQAKLDIAALQATVAELKAKPDLAVITMTVKTTIEEYEQRNGKQLLAIGNMIQEGFKTLGEMQVAQHKDDSESMRKLFAAVMGDMETVMRNDKAELRKRKPKVPA